MIDVTELNSKVPQILNWILWCSQIIKTLKQEKALLGISQHGGGILFSAIFIGSISDSKITEECGAVHLVEREHKIMSDHGFSIQELCASWGIILNRPKQKENDEFMEVDVAANFDVVATRIHVEQFIGWIRDWHTSSIWLIHQLDQKNKSVILVDYKGVFQHINICI